VGAGNALIIVDETADLKDAADKIMRSRTFDTSCSTENALAIQENVPVTRFFLKLTQPKVPAKGQIPRRVRRNSLMWSRSHLWGG